jgi:predicted DNA-binding transcriptional regulator YafY
LPRAATPGAESGRESSPGGLRDPWGAVARAFEFHPGQAFEEEPDGSLIVRFSAAGHLEMAWHLYIWGDQVDVLAPERLRQMIKGHRRADFPSLP